MMIFAQADSQSPTIGLLEIDNELISDGYTLFCPWVSSDCFLINNCGQKVNTWKTDLPFDLTMAYLDNQGFLYVLNNDVLVKYDWNSDRLWTFSSSKFGIEAHHDFQIMPNGNFMVIAREELLHAESTELGFQTELDENNLVAIDGLYEFKYIEDDSFDLVWKWNFKDHLIQETVDSLDNFGVVESAPKKLDVNFTNFPDILDWLHCNGIHYNEALDQVIISSRNTSEIYIIDHSTSIEEAATSVGGTQGFGGDFLWRWGKGNLMQQHDPNWIPEGHPNAGMISVFNNIDSSDLNFFSSIKIIDPPVDAQGKYELDTLNQFYPREANIIISGEEHEIFSPFMSGSHSQPNGNFIICSGRFGDFYEITQDGNLAWKYHNPIFESPLAQFSPAMAAFTFNIRKYPENFIGFEGKDLSPTALIENVNPVSDSCILSTDVKETAQVAITLFPNPSSGKVFYKADVKVKQVKIFALSGKIVAIVDKPVDFIDLSLDSGSYIFQFHYEDQIINKLVSVTP